MVQTAKVLLTQSLTTDPLASKARNLLQEILNGLPEVLTKISVTETEETGDVRLNTLRFFTPCKKQGSLVYFPNGVVQNKLEYTVLNSWIPGQKMTAAAEKKNSEFRKKWRKVSVEDLRDEYFGHVQIMLNSPEYSFIRYRLGQRFGTEFVPPKLGKNIMTILSVCNDMITHGLNGLDEPILNKDLEDLNNRLSKVFRIEHSVDFGLRISLFVLNPTGTHVKLTESAILGRTQFFSGRPTGDNIYTLSCLYRYIIEQTDLYDFFEKLFPDWRSFNVTNENPLE